MYNLFAFWSKKNALAERLIQWNISFTNIVMNYSWYIYLIISLLIICCTFYYALDCKHRADLKRRRLELQRASERQPQQRRPGAIRRNHEIFRNAVGSVREYIVTDKADGTRKGTYTLKRTRSGAIYGCFADECKAQ